MVNVTYPTDIKPQEPKKKNTSETPPIILRVVVYCSVRRLFHQSEPS